MSEEEEPDRTEVLRIRCTSETLTNFKRYAADFDVYEDALKDLLREPEAEERIMRGEEIRIDNPELLEWVDREVEHGLKFDSRSDAVKTALERLKEEFSTKPF